MTLFVTYKDFIQEKDKQKEKQTHELADIGLNLQCNCVSVCLSDKTNWSRIKKDFPLKKDCLFPQDKRLTISFYFENKIL